MVIVVTGMTGVDKKSYLEQACRLASKNGMDILLCNVGDMMYREAPDIRPGHILDIPLKRLHLLRRSIIKDIINRKKDHRHIIVNTHAAFRWRHGLFPAFDFDQMQKLDADIYICLIDGLEALHSRLLDRHHVQHTLKDLLVWREEEILATEMMRNGTNPKAALYTLARGEDQTTTQTFCQLLFEPGRKKAYLSFPMTHVMGIPAVVGEIQEFRNLARQLFTCFDPADLEEAYLPYYAEQAKAAGLQKVDISYRGQNLSFAPDELLGIENDINSQIYARDFALIDQADMIISCVPAFEDGRAAISSGVERELQHAHEAAKEVYVIWKAQRPPSVFVTQTATKIFKNTAEAVWFFRQKGFIQ